MSNFVRNGGGNGVFVRISTHQARRDRHERVMEEERGLAKRQTFFSASLWLGAYVESILGALASAMALAVLSACRSRVGQGKSLATIWWPPGVRATRIRVARPAAARKRSSSPDPQQQSQQQSKQSTESTAPRVEPNSLISVRKQIRYVKQLKEIERKSAFRAPKKERTKESYRKETLSEEERYHQKKLRKQEEMQLVRVPL